MTDTPTSIRDPLPGPAAEAIVQRDHESVATTTKTLPIVGESASGSLVWDTDGSILLDFSSGIGVVNTGHCHPRVVEAITGQARQLIHFAGTDFYYDLQVRLAERLDEITDLQGRYRSFFTNSGTEAIEAALKLTRWTGNRNRHIAFIGAFHGRTLGALSLTASKPVQQRRFFPTMPGVHHVPFAYCYRCPYQLDYPSCDLHCARMIEEQLLETHVPPDEVASLFIEIVQGEGGYIPAPPGWPELVEEICRRHGILLVVDEVQTGFGRTGRMFAFQHHDITPDAIAMAKGMGSGMPIGACVYRNELDFGVQGAHSNTYGGNLVASAAALATIEVIEDEDLVQRSADLGRLLHARLRELQEDHPIIGDVRGLGLMQAIELVRDPASKERAVRERDQLVELAWRRGLILLPCGRSGIRFIPPLVITEEQLDHGLDLFTKALRALQ